MSEDSLGPPFKTSPQHDFLALQEGDWDVQCAYSMGPDADPIEVPGSEKAEMIGPFWLVTRFEADLLGTPMCGQASFGYDPVKKVFVGTWKDSSIPFHYTFEGFLDDDQKVLKMSGENYDPMRGLPAIYRTTTEYLSNDEKRMTLTVELDSGETNQILQYHYRRK